MIRICFTIEESLDFASGVVSAESDSATPLERRYLQSVVGSLDRLNNPVSLRAAELARKFRAQEEEEKKR